MKLISAPFFGTLYAIGVILPTRVNTSLPPARGKVVPTLEAVVCFLIMARKKTPPRPLSDRTICLEVTCHLGQRLKAVCLDQTSPSGHTCHSKHLGPTERSGADTLCPGGLSSGRVLHTHCCLFIPSIVAHSLCRGCAERVYDI